MTTADMSSSEFQKSATPSSDTAASSGEDAGKNDKEVEVAAAAVRPAPDVPPPPVGGPQTGESGRSVHKTGLDNSNCECCRGFKTGRRWTNSVLRRASPAAF